MMLCVDSDLYRKESKEYQGKDRYNTTQGKVIKNIGYLAFYFCFLITIHKLKESRLHRKKIAKNSICLHSFYYLLLFY